MNRLSTGFGGLFRCCGPARRWELGERRDSQLLRGEEIDTAKSWMAARKTGAPEITDVQRAFLVALVAQWERPPQLAAPLPCRSLAHQTAYLNLRLTNRVITTPSHTANQPNTTTPKSIASIFFTYLDRASLKHRLLTEIEGSYSASGFNGSFTYCSHSLLNSANLPCKASSCFSLYKMYPAYPATPKIQITDITMPFRCHTLSFIDTANLQGPHETAFIMSRARVRCPVRYRQYASSNDDQTASLRPVARVRFVNAKPH
jgi:hypothetical protein